MGLSVNREETTPYLELPPCFVVPAPIWRSPGCSYTLLQRELSGIMLQATEMVDVQDDSPQS